MSVDWGKELGIDLNKLLREHPGQWEQLMMKKRLNQRAEDYWAKERFLSQLEDTAMMPEATHTPPKRKPYPKRSSKVRRYEFTDQQLEIARRSLSAGDSV